MRIHHFGRCLSFVLVLVASMASSIQADLIVSNLDQPIRSETPIANLEYWGAQSFFTGVDNFELTSIEAMAGNAAMSPLVVAELRRSDLSGQIDLSAGGLITTFLAADLTGAASSRLFPLRGGAEKINISYLLHGYCAPLRLRGRSLFLNRPVS